jgi:hypothetical protein
VSQIDSEKLGSNKLKKKEHHWIMAAIFAIALSGIMIVASPSGETSQVHKQAGETKYQQPAKDITDGIITIAGGWIERNKDAVNAVSTIFVALFTFSLWRATVALWKVSDLQRTELIRATDISAQQIGISGALADIAIKQKEITRLQYLAEHRPRIIVRNMRMPIGISDVTLKTNFMIYNIGANDAAIISVYALVFVIGSNELIPTTGISYRELSIKERTLPCSGFESFSTEMDEISFEGAFEKLDTGNFQVCCIGMVLYGDGKDARYRMGFARNFDKDTWRFSASEDQDYEYSY